MKIVKSAPNIAIVMGLASLLALCLIACPPGNGEQSPLPSDQASPSPSQGGLDQFFWGRWGFASGSSGSYSGRFFHFGGQKISYIKQTRQYEAGVWDTVEVSQDLEIGAYDEGSVTAGDLSFSRLGDNYSIIKLKGRLEGESLDVLLYRDGGKASTSGFSFHLYSHVAQPAAARGRGRALGLGAANSIELVITNIVNDQDELIFEKEDDEQGSLVEVESFVPGDTYQVADSEGNPLGLLNPGKDDQDLGSIVATSLGYNFKARAELDAFGLEDGSPLSAYCSEDFYFAGRDYPARLAIRNEGALTSPRESYSVEFFDLPEGLSLSGFDQGRLNLYLAPGQTSLTDFTVRAEAFSDAEYRDFYPRLRITDYQGNVWEDSIALRFWRSSFLVDIQGSGAIISPEKRSISFSSRFTGLIPARDSGYLVCLSSYASARSPYYVSTQADGVDGQLLNSYYNDADSLADNDEAGAVDLPLGCYYRGQVHSGDPLDFLRIGLSAERQPYAIHSSQVDDLPMEAVPGLAGFSFTPGSAGSLSYGGEIIRSLPARTRFGSVVGGIWDEGGESQPWVVFSELSDDVSGGATWRYSQVFCAHLSGGQWIFDTRRLPSEEGVYAPYGASGILTADYSASTPLYSELDFAIDSSGGIRAVASTATNTQGSTQLCVQYLARLDGSWSAQSGFQVCPYGYIRPGFSPTIAMDASDRVLIAWREGSRPMYAIRQGDGSWLGGPLSGLGSAKDRAYALFESGKACVYWTSVSDVKMRSVIDVE